MQGLFRNPMADPGIIGVSAGGAVGAVIAIATGMTGLFFLALPVFAFVGAMAAAVPGVRYRRRRRPLFDAHSLARWGRCKRVPWCCRLGDHHTYTR